MLAQKIDLIDLTKGLKLVNVYSDSQYAFVTAHVHGAIYHERGLLTAEGKTIKNKQEILDLLAALWLPKNWPLYIVPDIKRDRLPEAIGTYKEDLMAREPVK